MRLRDRFRVVGKREQLAGLVIRRSARIAAEEHGRPHGDVLAIGEG
jgi:hypothetical protein